MASLLLALESDWTALFFLGSTYGPRPVKISSENSKFAHVPRLRKSFADTFQRVFDDVSPVNPAVSVYDFLSLVIHVAVDGFAEILFRGQQDREHYQHYHRELVVQLKHVVIYVHLFYFY